MYSSSILALAAVAAPALAQTFSACNPLKQSGCAPDPALGKSVFYDFTQGASQDFTISTGSFPTFESDGLQFSIAKSMDSPTITSKWYMMFGYYEVVMKSAPGVGVVSSLVLLSDDLDEIDWEWCGYDDQHVQSNYYGKGSTETYDRGANLTNPGSQDGYHKYAVEWTADHITWAVDDQVLRTLTPETADKDQYPQTPMQFKMGMWPAGDPSQPEGTRNWAGGEIDYSKGPFNMTVKSVKAVDYSTGSSYQYTGTSGDWTDIKANDGQVMSSGNSGASASTAAASGTVVTSMVSTQGLSQVPVTATTTKTGELSSATGSLATATGTGGIIGPSGATKTGLSTMASPTASSGATGTASTSASGTSSTAATTTGAASSFQPVGASFGLLAALVAALML